MDINTSQEFLLLTVVCFRRNAGVFPRFPPHQPTARKETGSPLPVCDPDPCELFFPLPPSPSLPPSARDGVFY